MKLMETIQASFDCSDPEILSFRDRFDILLEKSPSPDASVKV